MRVPFVDLNAQHDRIRAELEGAIGDVIDSGAFAGGPFVEKFEANFATYCGCEHAVGVGNGTDALWLSLLALGIGAGDEVITVPNTFMATAEAISYSGARPVFVDVDDCTYTMDPAGLEAALSPRTKAIIPVHLFGQMADMDPILEFARSHNLFVIEDAAQAHGAKYNGQGAGTMGDVGCFSFYPGKNLGAFGEAGAVITNNPDVQEKIRALRDHGQVRKYRHSLIGWNCRMDGIQAAVLSVKLQHLGRGNSLRRDHAQRYDRELKGLEEIVTPFVADYAQHVYYIYAIRVREWDEIMWFLNQQGIQHRVQYRIPIHLQKAYRDLGYQAGSFPVAEGMAREFISLPMYPELRPAQTDSVVFALREALLNGAMKYEAPASSAQLSV